MKRIKVTAIVPDLSHGLFWQRLRVPFSRLNPAKFDVQFTTFGDSFIHYDNQTDIFVFAHCSQHEELRLISNLRHQGKRVIVDIDDLLDNPPTSHPELDLLLHCRGTIPEILMQASLVVTSTPSLLKAYKHLNKHMEVVQNSLCTRTIPDTYRPQKKHYHNVFTAGWCGGRTHIDDIYEMAFGLDSFLENSKNSRAHFKALCPQFLHDKWGSRVFFDAKVMHFLEYQGWIGTLPWDVCLVPLVDHPFNDGKSDLRFIEMARHKIPIICSPRASFIEHCMTARAFSASSNGQFSEALHTLMENPKLQQKTAEAAFDYVMSHRLDVHAAKDWEIIFKKTMSLG